MSLDTQPRDDSGRFGEKPDVGIARRMTEQLQRLLGHDGTDTPTAPVAQVEDVDVEAVLARQSELLDAIPDAPSPAPGTAPVEQVSDDARIDAQLAALDAATVPDSPAELTGDLAGAGAGGKSLDLDARLEEQLATLDALEASKTIVEHKDVPDDDVEVPLFEDDPEEKVRKWDPDKHPRDGHGRFATIGSTVSLPASLGGGEGRVLKATGGGNILVRKSDGTEVDVPAADTEVTRSAAANAAHDSFNNRAGAAAEGFQAAGQGTVAAPTRAAGAARRRKPGPLPSRPDANPKPAGRDLDAGDRPLPKPAQRTQAEADAARRAIEEREARGEFTVGTSVRGPDGRTTITAINPDGSYELADGNTLPGPVVAEPSGAGKPPSDAEPTSMTPAASAGGGSVAALNAAAAEAYPERDMPNVADALEGLAIAQESGGADEVATARRELTAAIDERRQAERSSGYGEDTDQLAFLDGLSRRLSSEWSEQALADEATAGERETEDDYVLSGHPSDLNDEALGNAIATVEAMAQQAEDPLEIEQLDNRYSELTAERDEREENGNHMPGYSDELDDLSPDEMTDEQLRDALDLQELAEDEYDSDEPDDDLRKRGEALRAEQESRNADMPAASGPPVAVDVDAARLDQMYDMAEQRGADPNTVLPALANLLSSLQQGASGEQLASDRDALHAAIRADRARAITEGNDILDSTLSSLARTSNFPTPGDAAYREPEPSSMTVGPGASLFDDDMIDRSAWTGGKPPNRADGTGTRPDGEPWGSGYTNPADPRNDPAYDQYTHELDAKLEETLAEIGDTETIHDKVDGVPGAYRPERQAQHDQLLDELIAGYAHVPKENKAIVMAGPPGAGKTTVLKTDGATFGVEMDGGTPKNYAVVNPDDMKEIIVAKGLIPDDYPGRGIGPGESATFLHEESSHLAARLLTRLRAEGYNVILDGTFSGNPDKQAGKVTALKEGGYTVTGVLVDGTVDRSLENAARRHRKPPATPGGGYQGRYVPYGLIETNRPTEGAESEVFGRPHRNKASENIERVQGAFDGGVLWYDNSTGASQLVHRVGPGQSVTTGNSAKSRWKPWVPKGTDRSAEVSLEPKAAGGADRNRGNAERLRRYWVSGAGGQEIRWGTDGDFTRCVALVSEHMDPERAKGYCNLRHQDAVGKPPGQGPHAGHKAIMEALGLEPMLAPLEVKAEPATDPAANAEGVANTNPEPTGVMVALYPPDDIASALALDTGEAVGDLHVTLAYLGSVEDVGLERVGDLVQLVSEFAADSYDQAAEIAGIGRWEAGDDGDAFVALVDGPELPDLRADLVDALAAAGFPVKADHGFTPHITLAYLDPNAESPLERLEALPATFEFLSVAVGTEVWDFPLNADDDRGER